METNICLPHISLILFFMTFTCKITEGAPGVNALQQLLSENGRGAGYDSFESTDTRSDEQSMQQLLEEMRLAKVLQLLKENSALEQTSKRFFCNEVVGCRNRKRTFRPLRQPSVNKRPFCNGFFGCSNGKRSKPVTVVEEPALPEVSNSRPQKRLFCNMTGCSNGKKRTLYDTLLDSLKSDKDLIGSEGEVLQILQNNRPLQFIVIEDSFNELDRTGRILRKADKRNAMRNGNKCVIHCIRSQQNVLDVYLDRNERLEDSSKFSSVGDSSENEDLKLSERNVESRQFLYPDIRPVPLLQFFQDTRKCTDLDCEGDFYDKQHRKRTENDLLLQNSQSAVEQAMETPWQPNCVVIGSRMICQHEYQNCRNQPCGYSQNYIITNAQIFETNSNFDETDLIKESGLLQRLFTNPQKRRSETTKRCFVGSREVC